MVIVCDNCGLKYKVDPSEIKKEKARLTCRGCSNVIIVYKQELIEEPLVTAAECPSFDTELPAVDTVFPSGDTTENEAEVPIYQPPALEKKVQKEALPVPPRKKPVLGLTAKVIIIMLLVGLLPSIVYFAITFHQTDERINEETTKSGMQVAEMLTDEVNEWVDKNVRTLGMVAKLPMMESMDRQGQEAVLKEIQREYPWVYLSHTIDLDGRNVARSDDGELIDYGGRQYVQDILKGKELAWQNLIGRTSQKPALVLAVPIKNNGQLVGILSSAMTLEAISTTVANWKQGETGHVFIADENGKIIAHHDQKLVQDHRDVSKHPLVVAAMNQIMSLVEFKDFNARDSIGFVRKTKLNWTLAVQQEKSEAFAALGVARNTAFLLFAAAVFSIVTIAYFASRAIVGPVRNLTDAANRISVGDLSVEIVKVSQDEIGDLADAITRMQDSIRLSIERLRRKKR